MAPCEPTFYLKRGSKYNERIMELPRIQKLTRTLTTIPYPSPVTYIYISLVLYCCLCATHWGKYPHTFVTQRRPTTILRPCV